MLVLIGNEFQGNTCRTICDLFPLSTKKVLQLPILLYAEYIWRTEETRVIVIILEDRVWAVKGLFCTFNLLQGCLAVSLAFTL